MDYVLWVSDNFPIEDIAALGLEIEASKLFIPGYIAPTVGLTSPAGLIFSKEHEGLDTFILPDRNLVTRIAKIAKQGIVDPDQTSRNALIVMAFCKGMDLLFEPSIAYHELAYGLGNEEAVEELSWFRGGDNHDTQEWIDLSFGRISQLSRVSPVPDHTPGNLAFPLHRWKRNYAAVLKTAALELSNSTPAEKSLTLLRWMETEFMVAGPALMFAQHYLSPNSRKKRLLKGLRSADRAKAIQGAKNAAWDITHLSDFVRRVEQGVTSNIRYIFATADRLLGELAPKLMIGNGKELRSQIHLEMHDIWGAHDGAKISEKLADLLELAWEYPTRRDRTLQIDEIIASLEHDVTSWRP